MGWWQSLSSLQQVFWVLALASSTIFLLSTLMSIFGFGDSEVDFDVDTSSDGVAGWLEFLSFRSIVAFTLGFSWTGILFYSQLKVVALFLAVLVGVGFAVLNFWLMKKLRGLETSGNSNLNQAIGQEARVSVEINAKLQGKGKVVVRVGERELELLAVTEDPQSLQRGEKVQVYNVENNLLFVSREDKLGLHSL